MSDTPLLEIRSLGKRFPARHGREPSPWVIQDLSFSVGAGEFLTIIGPSGAGKSTLLNMIAQIDTASAGEIVFNGETVNSHDARMLRPGFDRRIGYVTQDDNLLPWRTTIDNVLFPIEVQGRLNDETRARADVLVRAVGLAGFERYYPHELSGGMRKRAALIRTLAYDPPVILMDEPFAAVDAQTRTQLQADLLTLWGLGRNHHLRHPRHHRGDRARRPRAGAQPAADADRRRARDPDSAPAQRAGHFRARRLCRGLPTHPVGHPMTDAGLTAAMVSDAPAVARKRVVVAGRLLLALLLVLGWELGARTLGSAFFAAPLDVAARIVTLARSGQLAADVASTLRVSALGFAIACVAGVLLPFLLRRSPRVSAAVEPYIMASMGIPKYALAPWLILWFGIGDLPKLVVVTLMVFYIIFITTSAGIRAVDQRLIAMARIAGAGETAIAREIIWKSLLPFFFTGLKVALPRAVSATIVGEFLVATEGVGHYIEHSRQVADTVGVFAGIVIAMVLVLAINAVVNVIERRALAWRPVEREMEL